MVAFRSIMIGLPENFAEEFVGVDPSKEKSEGFSQVSSVEILLYKFGYSFNGTCGVFYRSMTLGLDLSSPKGRIRWLRLRSFPSPLR